MDEGKYCNMKQQQYLMLITLLAGIALPLVNFNFHGFQPQLWLAAPASSSFPLMTADVSATAQATQDFWVAWADDAPSTLSARSRQPTSACTWIDEKDSETLSLIPAAAIPPAAEDAQATQDFWVAWADDGSFISPATSRQRKMPTSACTLVNWEPLSLIPAAAESPATEDVQATENVQATKNAQATQNFWVAWGDDAPSNTNRRQSTWIDWGDDAASPSTSSYRHRCSYSP